MAGETEVQRREIPLSTSNTYSFAITVLIAISQKSVYCPKVEVPEMPPQKVRKHLKTPGENSCCEVFVRRRASWFCLSLRVNAVTVVMNSK